MAIIEIIHHGAVHGVTGSCHQYISSTINLLIDYSLFQGSDEKAMPSDLTFEASEIDALVVTHAHIDHIGRIPWLIASGFRGPIYCTKPTAQLLPVILRDAIEFHIKDDDELINIALKRIESQITGIDYGIWFVPGSDSNHQDTKLRFQPAGHILGSAYVEIEDKGHHTVFSGDLGSPGATFVDPPQPPEKADVLVIESTYGSRLHCNRENREQLLAQLINKALSDNGTLLIPAFSLGRTQELLATIEALLFLGQLNWNSSFPLPVILDSPLASELTQAYRALNEYWPFELKQRQRSERLPLGFDNLITVDSYAEHSKLVRRLAESEQPAIVIAASGMCQGGRILNYLKELLPLNSTEVLFIGYQAKGTLGNVLQNSKPGDTVRINSQHVEIQSQVYTISGFSAHADQNDLLNFIKGIDPTPAEIRLVHGDDEAKKELAMLLRKQHPDCSIVIPS